MREAYELIEKLKTIKNILQCKHGDAGIVNDIELYRKIRNYNNEIERITECIMNMEFDDSYEFDYDLYYIKDDEE